MMASLQVLAFDHEGRPIQFDTWLDDLQLYLLSDSKDGVSLFDLASGAATAPLATANNCYSSPAIAALGRLLLPYLFPQLSAFATVEDLVSQVRTSDARYRATVRAEFLDRNQPPMFITLYFIVTRLPESLRSVKDHFLSLDSTSLTVDLLEQHLLAAETSAVAVGAARGTPRPPFFEGCSPSPLAPSYTSVAVADVSVAAADVSVAEDVGAASASANHRSSKGKGGRGGGGGSGGGGGGSGSGGGGSSGGGEGSGGAGGSGTVVRHAGSFTLSTAASCASTSLGVLSLVTTSSSLAEQIYLGLSLYTLATEPPQVAATAQVSASGQVAASCSCRLVSHQTLLWHHRLGHPSLHRLRGMHSRLLVSGVPRSLPPLSPSPAPPCLPCVEGRQRTAPHSSFPPTTAPLQTLHMDVWGPARVSGQGRKHYFQLFVDNYTRYTTVFPLRSKGEAVDVLIPWTRTVRLKLRERFGQDLPLLRLHSDRGGEFSSTLLRDFSYGEGIL
ncbi:unnamed protein product [Closterium sp. NIES-53]